jgi:NitT/TauT family transport system permease protein
MTQRRWLDVVAPLATVAVLLGLWQLACWRLAIAPTILPAPSAIAIAGRQNLAMLLASAWVTLSVALTALIIASVIACASAMLVAASPWLERSVQPIVTTLQVTPIVAIAPLVVIWAGYEHPERAVTVLAVIVAFFPIYSGAVTGLKSADPDLLRLFQVHGASGIQILFRLRLPSAAPFLLQGHKVAAGLALVGAVVAEYVAGTGASEGLAWRILEAEHRLETAKMFAALIILALMGAAFYSLLQAAEQRILKRWRGR